MKKIILFKKGVRLKNKDPETVYNALENIRQSGDLTAQAVVDASRNKAAPLHKEFEWNNRKAGDEYRKEQARLVIRSVDVIFEKPDKTDIRTRAYEIRFEKPEQQEAESTPRSYDTIENVMADPNARYKLLEQAIADARRYREKYAALSEVSQIVRGIDEFLTSFKFS